MEVTDLVRQQQQSIHTYIEERCRRLEQSTDSAYVPNIRYLLNWMEETPAVSSVLTMIEHSSPDLDLEEWQSVNLRHWYHKAWPDREIERAKVCLHILRLLKSGTKDVSLAYHFSPDSDNYRDAIRNFTADVVKPLVWFIQDHLQAKSNILYLLWRYENQLLWFDHCHLWDKFKEPHRVDEKALDLHFREFLFANGVDYPISQPASPSGKADVIAFVGLYKPIACEVKVFDGKGRGRSYVKKGYEQARRYAEDFGETDAYLIVFNATDTPISFPTDDGNAGWPERRTHGGVTVFTVAVQIAPRPTTSRSHPKQAVDIDLD